MIKSPSIPSNARENSMQSAMVMVEETGMDSETPDSGLHNVIVMSDMML
jgi:hypothetical protein